ncbi:hypothetical protein SXIM_19080 [Streptomyces xiamenensis]|uniref:Uncharacterized protein n=1 Tax=Streptomyces xiamenensis TaxID=408015 RepID=A0A0F7FTB7_9ACTN|nr:hypothetical protein SXIM_19080 [Streptomyces xiamenensis]
MLPEPTCRHGVWPPAAPARSRCCPTAYEVHVSWAPSQGCLTGRDNGLWQADRHCGEARGRKHEDAGDAGS